MQVGTYQDMKCVVHVYFNTRNLIERVVNHTEKNTSVHVYFVLLSLREIHWFVRKDQ